MKKIVCLALSCIFALGVCFSAPITANALYTTSLGDWNIQYQENGTECYIINFLNNEATEATIPNTITVDGVEYTVTSYEMPQNPFVGCANLRTIKVEDGNTAYKVVDDVLYSADGKLLISYPAKKPGEAFTVPSEVEDFAFGAISSAEELKYVFYTGEATRFTDTYHLTDIAIHYGVADHQKRDTEEVISHPTCVKGTVRGYRCVAEYCDVTYDLVTDDDVCEDAHEPGEMKIGTPATCVAEGEMVRECVLCGKTLETEPIARVSHAMSGWLIESNPTCIAEGKIYRFCKNTDYCDYREEMILAATGVHTPGEWEEETPASCSAVGEKVKKCTVCGAECERAEIPAGHSFGEWQVVNEATCSKEGLKKRTCSACGAEETEAIEIKEHTPEAAWTFVKDSTCSEAGLLIKKCSGCGAEVDRAEIPKKDHSFSKWEEVTPAKCGVEGLEKRVCGNCGEEETRAIDALEHECETEFTVDVEPGCETEGSKSYHCKNEGCDYKEGITVIPATGHIYTEEYLIEAATCKKAGSKLEKCKCGAENRVVELPQLEHQFSEWEITKDATCEEAGSKSRICSACEEVETEAIEAINHKNFLLLEAREPSCTEKGFSGNKYCPDCDTMIEDGKVIPATGHTESEWIVDKPATFTEKGSKHKVCMVCEVELETAEIDVLTLTTPVVKAENASNGVKVTWTQDEDAANYIVYSSQYNAKTKSWSKWVNRGTLSAETSSWVDKKVKTGEKYKYAVRAVNGKYKSAYKECASLTYIEAPTVTCTISTTGILVKWNKVEIATGYTVYRSELVDGKWAKWETLGKTIPAKNSWLDDKAECGATYRYAIRANVGSIRSGYVAGKQIIFLEQPKVSISNAATGVFGAWELVDGATGYTIYRSELVNGKWTSWLNLGTTKANVKSFTDTTVKSGSKYKYAVKAVSGSFKSTYTATEALLYIAQPKVTISNVENGISGKWNQVKGATAYTIYRAELVDGEWSKWVNLGTAKSTAKTFTDKTVKCGVTYKYTVRATNNKVKSSYGDSNTLTFLSVPTVKASNAGTGVKVQWGKIAGATSYTVYRRESTDGKKWTAWKTLTSVEAVTYTDTTAVSNLNYQYTVRAVNGESRSVFKASATLYYLAAPVVAVEKGELKVTVNWNKVDGATSYMVYRSQMGEDGKWSGWKSMATIKDGTLSWTDEAVKEDVVYRYTVCSLNGKIKSSYVASENVVFESEKPEEEPKDEPSEDSKDETGTTEGGNEAKPEVTA